MYSGGALLVHELEKPNGYTAIFLKDSKAVFDSMPTQKHPTDQTSPATPPVTSSKSKSAVEDSGAAAVEDNRAAAVAESEPEDTNKDMSKMATDSSTNPELLESIKTADEFLAKGGWNQDETDDDYDSGEAYAEPKPTSRNHHFRCPISHGSTLYRKGSYRMCTKQHKTQTDTLWECMDASERNSEV